MNDKTDLVQKELYSISAKFGDIAKTHNAVEFAAECQFASAILKGNQYLTQIFYENPESLKGAVLNVAGSGLSLNPVKKHAYLVPRKINKCMAICLDVSYMGLIHLACDAGSIKWVKAETVRKKDNFTLKDIGTAPTHEFEPFGDRGDPVGVYCVAKTSDGDFLVETMTMEEVYAIRDRSEAYKAVVSGRIKSCPWTTDLGEMSKKTVIKRAAKTWPKFDTSHRLDEAINVINQHEGIDFQSEQQSGTAKDITPSVDYSLRELQINEIKEFLGFLTDGMDVEDKIKIMKETCGVLNFKDLGRKNNADLDEIIKKLSFEKLEKERSDLCKETSQDLKNNPVDAQEELHGKTAKKIEKPVRRAVLSPKVEDIKGVDDCFFKI